MGSIVVGTDGSGAAQAATRWAATVAGATGATVAVVAAFDPVESELPPARVDHLRAELAERLSVWAADAAAPGVTVEEIVETGDPRDAIQRVAERLDSGLIVVGRVGASTGPGFLHLSSVPEYLAHHCDRPLAVVGGTVSLPFSKILVATDGSENAEPALRWAAEVATASTASLAVVGVEAPEDPTSREVARSRRESQQHELRQRIETEWTAPLGDSGVSFEPIAMIEADAADGILRAADTASADLVVVGMRGLGGFTGLRVGRVALRTLHRADRPVVLVPPTP